MVLEFPCSEKGTIEGEVPFAPAYIICALVVACEKITQGKLTLPMPPILGLTEVLVETLSKAKL